METTASASGTGAASAPPAMAEVTLRTFALAATAALAYGDRRGDGAEARFLATQLQMVAGDGVGWLVGLPAYLRQPAASDQALIDLVGDLGLNVVELLAVALTAAVEDDPMVGRALAHLQAPIGGSRPTLALLSMAFAAAVPAGRLPIDLLVNGAAVRSGLLTILGGDAPLPERALSVALPLCCALRGLDGTWLGTTVEGGQVAHVPLPPSVQQEAERQAHALACSARRALVIRSGSAAEGRAVATAIAGALGCRALLVQTDTLGGMAPWLRLRRFLPVFCLEIGPGECKRLVPPPYYDGPVVALCGPDGSVEMAEGTVLSWTLPVPRQDERRLLWRTALGDDVLADELARHHRHASGRIAHLGRLVQHRSNVRGDGTPTMLDIQEASWVSEGAGLEGLAQPLRDAIGDDALVVPPALRKELDLLVLRCRRRDTLVDDLGAAATARYRPGVRALFVGPSGTGKTLAAGWLATTLGLPLYRVDLASVTSKYIGETEKNLAQLLARAEQSEVVLLFDEADAMFGKRTDVKEANDRFANAQTNYLLQRIESFDGIVVLTSNSRTRFDSAFTRRLDMIVDFPLPGPEERRGLWLAHLGSHHNLSPKEVNQLAATIDLCGGYIRNAVLAAAVLACTEQRQVTYHDVVRGLLSEYRKIGQPVPADLR